MVTLGILFFGALNSSWSAQTIFPIPRTRWGVFRVPFSHSQAGKQSARGKGRRAHTASHLTAVGVTRPALHVSVPLHCSEGWLAIWHLPPFLCTIVRISWVLFQSSLSCFHRHLLTFLELLQAHPATPTRAKDLLRRRKAAPMAAPLLWYSSDTACIICEASIMRSFFLFVPTKPWCKWGLFFPCGNRNSKVQHLAEGEEKSLKL